MVATLSLFMLGPLQTTLDGEPVTGFKSDKVRALLVYLAVEANQPHRRETLAGLLWPDWPDREARRNLRDVLSNLRRAIGDHDAAPPFLLISRETLQFNTEHQVYIGPMSSDELRRAIEEPARMRGWTSEPGLVDLILEVPLDPIMHPRRMPEAFAHGAVSG